MSANVKETVNSSTAVKTLEDAKLISAIINHIIAKVKFKNINLTTNRTVSKHYLKVLEPVFQEFDQKPKTLRNVTNNYMELMQNLG